MQFVNNLNNLILDDQYFMDVPVTDGSAAAPTGNIGLVGTFSRGPVNTPVLVTSYTDLVKKFGEVDADFTLTGAITARGIFKQGNANVYVVRVQSSSTPAKASTVELSDSTATPAVVLTLTAKTPGTWGNSLQVNVSDGTKTGTFKLVLQYGTESEVWDNLIIAQPTTPITGAVLATDVFGANGLSSLANATFPTTANLNTPASGEFALAGGTDGGNTVATDYAGADTAGVKTGLHALDSAPINFVLAGLGEDASAEDFATVNNALIDNATSITANGGLPRIAVLTFQKGTPINNLSTLTKQMDTDRAIAVYPWVQIFDAVTGSNRVVSPVGYFAGVVAQLKPHLSPGNKQVYGILSADPNLIIGPSDLVAMVQARVNALGVQTPAGPLGVRGGYTLSQQDESSQVYVRRMKDYIDQLVYSIGGQFVDQPITDDVMRHVYQSIDNILQPMKSPITKSDQMIADYKVVCDATNNPMDSIAQNRLICDYAVKLLNVNRFMIFRTQISSGVVITKQS
jgi:uncharacterized protein